MSWAIQYFDGTNWVQKSDAVLKYIMQELNGHEEAVFLIPNTSENRNFVSADRRVRVTFRGTVVYAGKLCAYKLRRDEIECIVYNECYEIMKARVHTGSYTNASASTVLAAICNSAGVTAGSCPTTSVSLRFDRTPCYDAAVHLASVLGKDFWGDYDANGNPRFNIGDRVNSSPYPSVTVLEASEVAIDRAKKRDKVIIRGVDASGNPIYAEAGSGQNVAVFTERKASDLATLQSLAQAKLAELNRDASGVKLTVKITEAYNLVPGYYVNVNVPELALSGSYRIYRITKRINDAEIEILMSQPILERYIQSVSKLEDLGIYPISANQIADGSITTSKLADGAVTETKIAPNAVTAEKILNGAITDVKLASGAVTLAKFASGIRPVQIVSSLPTLPDSNYPQGAVVFCTADNKLYRSTGTSWTAAVPTSDLVGQITETQIADNSISTPKLKANCVTADKIAANAITSDKIAANAVTAGKIAAGAVGTDQLAANAVTADKIQAGAVTASKLAVAQIFIDGLTFTDNSPSSGYVSWSACTVYYRGTAYSISSGYTNQKYIYWDVGNTYFSTSNDKPAWSDTRFLIAINDGGYHKTIWNATLIHGGSIIAGTVTAQELTADWITGKKFRTSGRASGSAGIEFDDSGIRGYSDATTVQFYIDASSGAAVAGGGNVLLDRYGVTVVGQYLAFLDSSRNTKGWIYGSSGGLVISGYNCPILATNLLPSSNVYYDLGSPSYKWNRAFAYLALLDNIGPYSDTSAYVYFRTRKTDGTTQVDHYFAPLDAYWGYVGTSDKYWYKMYTSWIYADDVYPRGGDNKGWIGDPSNRWAYIYAVNKYAVFKHPLHNPEEKYIVFKCVEGPKVTVEDWGVAELKDGVAFVTFSEEFAALISDTKEYAVFLTPEGECNGLYVSRKELHGFEVRELGGGKSNIRFSWQVKAVRIGDEKTPVLEDPKPKFKTKEEELKWHEERKLADAEKEKRRLDRMKENIRRYREKIGGGA
jgi:hypothetical protein